MFAPIVEVVSLSSRDNPFFFEEESARRLHLMAKDK